MRSAGKYKLVLVTAPDLRTARKLARAALKARLVACANLVPNLESHYWWREKMERAREVLLVLKTTEARVPGLEALILSKHPYDTPEFIVLSLLGGSRAYLDWINASCAPLKGARLRS